MSPDRVKPGVGRKPFPRAGVAALIAAMLLGAILLPVPVRAQTLVIGLEQGAFENPRVREAVVAAADWHLLAEQGGLKIDGILVRSGGREITLGRTRPDLDRAVRLLAQSGNSAAAAEVLILHDSVHARLAALAARSLESVGFKASPVPFTPQTLADIISRTRYATGQRTVEMPYLLLTQEQPAAPQSLPDLAVTGIRVDYDEQRQALAVRVEITNLGVATARANQLAIREPSGDSVFPPIRVGRLDSRQRQTIDRTIRVPDALLGRTLVLQFEIDPDNAVEESNEGNNFGKEYPVDIAEPAPPPVPEPERPPDLAVTETTASFDEPSRELKIFVTVENTGAGPAAPHSLAVYDHSGTVIILPKRVGTLDSGQRRTFEWTIPISTEVLGRTVVVQAEIDSERELDELDTRNNVGEERRVQLTEPPTLADLVIPKLQAEADGQSATVHITVGNRGGTPSPRTTIEIKVEGRAGATEVAVPSLPPGSEESFETPIALTAAMFGRDVQLTATVDPGGQVQESNETNNSDKTSLTLATPITTWIAGAVLAVGVMALFFWVRIRVKRRIGRKTGKDERERPIAPARVAFRPRSEPSTEQVEPVDDEPALVFRMALRPVADPGTQTASLDASP